MEAKTEQSHRFRRLVASTLLAGATGLAVFSKVNESAAATPLPLFATENEHDVPAPAEADIVKLGEQPVFIVEVDFPPADPGVLDDDDHVDADLDWIEMGEEVGDDSFGGPVEDWIDP